ncbi:MAG: type I DNA topoisomerase, partial [Thermodesulfobacteriota bacterium]|nr:type I DNA topoisomerase [Thermodesulfobacteriota bacterium]
MNKKLVIVESPAKAKTIEKFLGQDFKVLASYGHVRALPKKDGSVDVEKSYEPTYTVIPEKKKYIQKIKEVLAGCEEVYLATDLDREGEAIAWHLLEVLKLNKGKKNKENHIKIMRIIFNEITRESIQEAMKSPKDISLSLVNAQQARVVLDYLFGFNLSPFLWKKVKGGLSAGRVQSVALRLICEREKEIKAHIPQEYWTINATLSPEDNDRAQENNFHANLIEIDGKKLAKFDIKTQQEAEDIVKQIRKDRFIVAKITEKEVKKIPQPPFTTSTLQQEANKQLGFSAKKTMSLAQKLYEGIEMGTSRLGLITYMRTDSIELSQKALADMKKLIKKRYGKEYVMNPPRRFKNKAKNVQEAHEAIRPTFIDKAPDTVSKYLTTDELKLYTLIWNRTLASQMQSALVDQVSVDIKADMQFTFRSHGSILKFPGFLLLYKGADEMDNRLPQLEEGQPLFVATLEPDQHFTQPPPRFTEASLVKALEELGIGRPSTYATIIDIILARKYVKQAEKKFFTEDLGMIVNELLVTHFANYVDYQFTARLEEGLDNIAKGGEKWKSLIQGFWVPFKTLIEEKERAVKRSDTFLSTNEECPLCGGNLVIRFGRYGKFVGCANYPTCNFTKSSPGIDQNGYAKGNR